MTADLTLNLNAPRDFRFRSAVTSYGFFMLAPNRWEPDTATLFTVLDDGRCAWHVAVDAPRAGAVRLTVPRADGECDAPTLAAAVRRMLRLDEDLTPFHRLCRAHPSHAPAARQRFGRLLRSPTLFEDIVRTMCTCNITWRQTVAIVDQLVRQFGTPAANDPRRRAFPRPADLAAVSESDLRLRCKLGYRADWVRTLARRVAAGDLDLAAFENGALDTAELEAQLRTLRGVGPYAAAGLLMLLGRYDRLAIDSELLRHFRARHPRRRLTPRLIARHYQTFAPFAFLAYWYELWTDYTRRLGRSTSWSPDDAAQVTRRPASRPRPRRARAEQANR